MPVNLQTNFTSFPVHQSVAPYVQICSREVSQETATHFVLRSIRHSWGWALPPETLAPMSATAFPMSGFQTSLPTTVIQLLQLTGKRGVVVRGLKNCKPSLEASQLPDR